MNPVSIEHPPCVCMANVFTLRPPSSSDSLWVRGSLFHTPARFEEDNPVCAPRRWLHAEFGPSRNGLGDHFAIVFRVEAIDTIDKPGPVPGSISANTASIPSRDASGANAGAAVDACPWTASSVST
jgi:hypothetical protein